VLLDSFTKDDCMDKDIKMLNQDLREQLALIKNSCKLFDEGSVVEYKNLATRLRLLLHDTGKSKSLLKLLNIKDSILFTDTCLPYIQNDVSISWYGLVIRQTSFKDSTPIINEFPESITKVPFEQWWNKTILEDTQKNFLRRHEVILTVADKDGGAHIDNIWDEEKEKAFIGMQFQNSLGALTSKDGGNNWEVSLAIPSTIRQIAEEVLMTLDEEYIPSTAYKQKSGILMGGIQIGLSPKPLRKKIGRNDNCPCKSGQKYKRCCLPKGGIM